MREYSYSYIATKCHMHTYDVCAFFTLWQVVTSTPSGTKSEYIGVAGGLGVLGSSASQSPLKFILRSVHFSPVAHTPLLIPASAVTSVHNYVIVYCIM